MMTILMNTKNLFLPGALTQEIRIRCQCPATFSTGDLASIKTGSNFDFEITVYSNDSKTLAIAEEILAPYV